MGCEEGVGAKFSKSHIGRIPCKVPNEKCLHILPVEFSKEHARRGDEAVPDSFRRLRHHITLPALRQVHDVWGLGGESAGLRLVSKDGMEPAIPSKIGVS